MTIALLLSFKDCENLLRALDWQVAVTLDPARKQELAALRTRVRTAHAELIRIEERGVHARDEAENAALSERPDHGERQAL